MGELEHHDPNLRVSDADRHLIAEALREAAGEGRLEVDELDERLEAAYAAKTYADLVPLTADLPERGEQPSAPRPFRPAPRDDTLPAPTSSFSMMSGCTRRGVWQVGATHTAVSIMGGVDIDLREAHFTEPEVVITATAVMGAVDVIVNAGTRVTVEGVGVMGAFEEGRPKIAADVLPGAPHVRVKGVALMGAVTVIRKPMPGERGGGRKILGH